MTRKWTDEQQRAIAHRRGEAIVSASAGSGKTSVLIERTLRLIRARAADVDRMLIVTFTEDAAGQLKDRLRAALEAAYRQAGRAAHRQHLSDQIRRLDRARISTIHAFALRVLRENHHLLGLTADIRVLEAEVGALLRHRVADEVFEASYDLKDDFGRGFRALVDLYGGHGVDRALVDAVLGVHAFLASLVDPGAWIENSRRCYTALTEEPFGERSGAFWQCLSDEWRDVCRRATGDISVLIEAADRARMEPVAGYLTDVHDRVEGWNRWLGDGQYEALVAGACESLPRWRGPRSGSSDKPAADAIKARFDPIRARLKRLADQMCETLSAESVERMRNQTGMVDTFFELVHRFSIRLTEAKRELGQLDFDDLQRLALDVLNRPSVAEAYREQFEFVMVDEYQDVNALQDAIVRAVCRPAGAGRCENLLVVGDVKQSIYRFRLADPEVFQDLCRRAQAEPAGVERIDLRENFRSRGQVIDTVNNVFERLLVGGAVELDYDDAARLVRAGEYREVSGDDPYRTELLVLERKLAADVETEDATGAGDWEAIEREAYAVAGRVRRLIDSEMPIRDGDGYRAVREDDVVVLLRSLKYAANAFVSMFRRVGLHAYCQQAEAFLEYPEIADVVAILELIDNPYQDIPLATVLRSRLVAMTADDLARVRLAAPGRLYAALLAYTGDDDTGEKAQRFCRRLDDLRGLAGELSVGELVRTVYHRTGCRRLAEVGPGGEHARENLEQFLELARRFDDDGRSSLGDFLEYLTLLRDSGRQISSVPSGCGAGVRVTSIHASKGLEFPVVVLANLGKQVNLQDLRGDILVDRHLGIAFMARDEGDGSRTSTAGTAAIATTRRNQTVAEELRLLYVAGTRAKEKLILSGSARLDTLGRIAETVGAERPTAGEITDHTTPLAWLTLALAHADPEAGFERLLGADERTEGSVGGLAVRVFPAAEQDTWSMPQPAGRAELVGLGRRIVDAVSHGKAMAQTHPDRSAEMMLSQLDRSYPHPRLCTTSAKFGVTELARQAGAGSDQDDAAAVTDTHLADGGRFDPLSLEDSPAIVRGWVWHRFMEHVDIRGSIEHDVLGRQLAEMVDQGLLRSDHASLVDLDAVGRFFRSEPGRTMRAHHDAVHRELSFTYCLPAKDLPKSVCPGDFDEHVLIQGTVDCLVRTAAGLVIIDYKTNKIAAGEVDERTNHYRGQIALYTQALSRILCTRVASAWLYFTEPDSAVAVV